MNPSKSKILLIEDEPSIADTIIYPLETDGFEAIWGMTISEGRKAFRSHSVDLILLDVGLPDGNGFEFCKEIRKSSDVPIIFLTARREEIDRIIGLEIGGDDYVIKPFSPRELVSRVKAVLRRSRHKQHSPFAPGFAVNEDACKIVYRGKELELSRYEYRILEILVRRPGWIFSREKLMSMAWEEPESAMDRTIDAHIKGIRSKLRQLDPERDPIQTHRGMGYSLKVDE